MRVLRSKKPIIRDNMIEIFVNFLFFGIEPYDKSGSIILLSSISELYIEY